MATPIDSLCKGFGSEFRDYLGYCRNLRFEERPDYAYCRGLLREVLGREATPLCQDPAGDWGWDWAGMMKAKEEGERGTIKDIGKEKKAK